MSSLLLDVLGSVLLILGLALMTLGVYGVLRMSDTYSQLHAQGLATGPGVLCVLASSVATEDPTIMTFAGLGIAFVVVTSPVSAYAIARAAQRRESREE